MGRRQQRVEHAQGNHHHPGEVPAPYYGTTTVPTDEDNTTVAVWTDQPAYARDASGNFVRVNYRLTENVTGLDGYTTSYLVEDVGNWDGNVSEFDISSCTEQLATGLTRMTTFVNTYDVKDSITVTKIWDDADDAEGLRPDEVVVHLYHEPSVVLTENEMYALQQQAYNSVNQLDYDTDNSGAMDTWEEYDAYMTAVQNKYQELVDAEIAARKAVAEPLQVEVAKKTIKKNDNGTWTTATWDNLPLFDAEGELITYIVEEESVAGYTTTYSVDNKATYGADKNRLTLDGVTGAQNVDVKNSLTPATEKVTVTKVWDDGKNVDGKRPGSGVSIPVYEYVWTESGTSAAYQKNDTPVATITLDGTADAETTGDTIKTQETAPVDGNTWTGKVTDLPATKNGKTVIYDVDETQLDDYDTPVITGNQVDGFTVTNTRKQDTIAVTVKKAWVGDKEEYRPDHVTVTLKADGATVTQDADGNAVAPLTITGSDWANADVTFGNLPKYKLVNTADDGADPVYETQPIEYTVEETPVGGYTTTYAEAYNAANEVLTGLNSAVAKGELKTIMDNQKARLIASENKLLSAEIINEMVASLANVEAVAQAQDLYEADPDATDFTGFIKNPDFAAITGWDVTKVKGDGPIKSGQYYKYSEETTHNYFDSYNSEALDIHAEQVIANIPNGTYTARVAARTSGAGSFIFAANGGAEKADTMWVEIPVNTYTYVDGETGDEVVANASDINGPMWQEAAAIMDAGFDEAANDLYLTNSGNGRGWMWLTIENIVVNNHTIVLGMSTNAARTGKQFEGKWFSIVDWSLELTEKGDNSGWNGPITAVNDVTSSTTTAADGMYDIQGRRVSTATRGLYIRVVNGKAHKIMVQ